MLEKKVKKSVGRKRRSKKVKKSVTRKPRSKKVKRSVTRKPRSKKVKKSVGRKPRLKKVKKSVGRKPRLKNVKKSVGRKPRSKKLKKSVSRKSKSKKVKRSVTRKPRSKKVKRSVTKKPVAINSKKFKFGESNRPSNKEWDILIHASHPRNLQKIIDDKELKTNKKQIDAWLQNDDTKKYFGNYFLENNNRYKVIESVIENANDTKSLKLKQTKNKLYKPDEINEDELNWIYAPGVYTTYIWDDLNYDGNCWSFNCSPKLIFGISTKILKDKPWIACEGNVYGDCIKDNPLKKGWYGTGNLNDKPNMKVVKEGINNRKDQRDFVDSHEIIFDKIPLEYINVILTTEMFLDKVKEIVKDLNIPVVEIPDSFRDRKDYKNILKAFSY